MTDVINQLTARIIPCLDVDNGRVVKGTNFVNLRDMGDPVELAIRYEQQGADEIVFLDISASSDNRPTALKNVTAIAKNPWDAFEHIERVDHICKIVLAAS